MNEQGEEEEEEEEERERERERKRGRPTWFLKTRLNRKCSTSVGKMMNVVCCIVCIPSGI